jgi:hypothetical protein
MVVFSRPNPLTPVPSRARLGEQGPSGSAVLDQLMQGGGGQLRDLAAFERMAKNKHRAQVRT